MQRVPVTGDHKAFVASMRKKLFVAAAYLLVSAALLVLVSYGQFKIRIVGELDMPQAAVMQAQIDLAQSIENHGTGLDQFLIDLLPDDSASQFRTYAQEGEDSAYYQTAVRHRIDVKIYNTAAKTNAGGEGEQVQTVTESAETDMRYTLRIYSENRLPMQFVLVDHQNGDKDYLSKKIDGVYYFYDYTSETVDGVETRTETNELVFDLGADPSGTFNSYTIYAGWDNTGLNADEIHALNDMSFRKEVELLELRADVVNKAMGMQAFDEAAITDETKMQNATVPVAAPTPAPTDEPVVPDPA